MADSLQKQINRKKAGTILTRQDFPDYPEEFVGFTLSESVASGVLLRLAQGIYYNHRTRSKSSFCARGGRGNL